MFISFFTGKIMLFYGISLIMKEKSNASALTPPQRQSSHVPETVASRPRGGRLTAQRRSHHVPEEMTSIRIVFS